MKKIALLGIAAFALALVLAPLSFAAEGTWTGWISDEHCGAAGAKAGHEDCAKKCVKGGGKYVFVNSADKKVYAIDNQELAAQNLGFEITLSGNVEGTAIKVASIAKKQ